MCLRCQFRVFDGLLWIMSSVRSREWKSNGNGEDGHGESMMNYFGGGYLSNQPYFGYYSNAAAQMMPLDMHHYYSELPKIGMEAQMLSAASTQQQQQQQQQIGPGEPLFFGEPHHHPKQKRNEHRRRGSTGDGDGEREGEGGSDSEEEGETCSIPEKETYGPPGANLFIFHLPSELTNYQLYHLFSHAGKILSVRIMINYSTGLSRGYGFVSFSTPEEAARAIRTMHGYSIGRKRLKVQLKQEDLLRTEEWGKLKHPADGGEEEEEDEGYTTPPSGMTSSATSLAGDEPYP